MFSEMGYHLWRFMALGPNDEWYVHIHGIVCLNMPVLGTNVYLGTVNNVAEETFHFPFTKKSFFYFRMRKMGYFVKQLPKLCCKIGALYYLKILDHMYLRIIKWLCVKQFSSTSRKKDKFMLIQLERGQIWTTGAS